MLLEKLDQYIESIRIDEKTKIKELDDFEISELLNDDNNDDILSRLDSDTVDRIKKMKEGGLI